MKLYVVLFAILVSQSAWAQDEKNKNLVPNPDLLRAMPKPLSTWTPGQVHEALGVDLSDRTPVLLADRPDPNSLPVEVLSDVLRYMVANSNAGTVAIRASNSTDFRTQTHLERSALYAKANLRDANAQLTPQQLEIARQAFDYQIEHYVPLAEHLPEIVTMENLTEFISARGITKRCKYNIY